MGWVEVVMWEFMGVEGGISYYSLILKGIQCPVMVYKLKTQEELVVGLGGNREDNEFLDSCQWDYDIDGDVDVILNDIREDSMARGVCHVVGDDVDLEYWMN
jgi:hypothetical protein